jgi:hypothetical protein
MDWDEALAEIEHGYGQDTAACKYGGHRIHQLADGAWADDDGVFFCLQAITAAGPHALHEPVQMPPHRRSGTL